ncbi:MAG: uridine diphosphate-N-acetylglucosamine-binding protein YvcK [Anaerolineae bacterium]|jgi:uncharacterized cofD-like protein|nr:uridine diphosphate-N-acetylglucosamine-binding protein YvcK [Anaerolineae bacterium]
MFRALKKWLTPGIGIKRWLLLLAAGIFAISFAVGNATLKIGDEDVIEAIAEQMTWAGILTVAGLGALAVGVAVLNLSRALIAPYRRGQPGDVLNMVMEHTRRTRGIKFVAIGGGSGLPAALRGMKRYTGNITAIVTVADDGGSSGRLRRDMGVAPPGDLRQNIAALADEDSLLTQLFQYRFKTGDLEGHAFGNLFIAALADIVGEHSGNRKNSLAEALTEVERVLNIQGRVLPATLEDMSLKAQVRLASGRTITVMGEAQTAELGGAIESIAINPPDVPAYPESVNAIMEADIVVLGPGSLYTSILPGIMVKGIADALRATSAYKIYICNVATQPVETEDYTVAEHVMALERHIGRGVFQAVMANNAYPLQNAGENTRYVSPAPADHEILQRYEVRYTELVDDKRPWRHDPYKLAAAIADLMQIKSSGL